jgi:hypothetical protein
MKNLLLKVEVLGVSGDSDSIEVVMALEKLFSDEASQNIIEDILGYRLDINIIDIE